MESYSQLIRDFSDHENFLACGEELFPLELAQQGAQGLQAAKRPLPGGGGADRGGKRGQKKNPRCKYSRAWKTMAL